MKEEYDVRGRRLRRDCYDVYARYFVKYIQEMAKQGIRIDALTIQNEPLNNRNTPSMPWDPQDQTEFIRDYLGPHFLSEDIDTRIILFDHNCDRPDYPPPSCPTLKRRCTPPEWPSITIWEMSPRCRRCIRPVRTRISISLNR